VAPLGADATTVATRGNLQVDRCVALDTLVWPTRRHTLMKTVSTRSDVCDAMHAMLARAGSVSVVEDSNGFVAQRLVASIVNIACDAAQQRIASPADIELAATLGLGYPTGPLALGDRLGARKILTVLDRIFDGTKDPRYRSSPWLRRRAIAGIPLSA
jgi:3-hydroxybutyryl-CoA dehydrogenase